MQIIKTDNQVLFLDVNLLDLKTGPNDELTHLRTEDKDHHVDWPVDDISEILVEFEVVWTEHRFGLIWDMPTIEGDDL